MTVSKHKTDSSYDTRRATRSINVVGTAYTAYCAGCSGKTSTGDNLRANPNLKIIAVDPRVVPLGSTVRLTSKSYPKINGVYKAGDTGGAIKGTKIDIFISDLNEAKRLGVRRDIVLEVLEEGK